MEVDKSLAHHAAHSRCWKTLFSVAVLKEKGHGYYKIVNSGQERKLRVALTAGPLMRRTADTQMGRGGNW